LEGGSPAQRRDQLFVGKRAEDRLTRTVSADHQPDDQRSLVGEPLRRDRSRRRIPEAVADADDDAEEDVEGDERRREARQEKSGAHQETTDIRAYLRPPAILQATGGD